MTERRTGTILALDRATARIEGRPSMYDQEQEFRERLAMLNALTDVDFQWQWRTARKNHIDEFGDAVRAGEQYFRRDCVGAYHDVIKMSRASMEKLLEAMFRGNQFGALICAKLAANLKAQHDAELRKAVNALESRSPLTE